MNAFTKQALAALVLAGAVAVPASANIHSDVQEAISGGGNIIVTVRDGTATLTGYSRAISAQAAERAALDRPEVDRVINLVTKG